MVHLERRESAQFQTRPRVQGDFGVKERVAVTKDIHASIDVQVIPRDRSIDKYQRATGPILPPRTTRHTVEGGIRKTGNILVIDRNAATRATATGPPAGASPLSLEGANPFQYRSAHP